MPSYNETIFCDGCGVEITWSPIIVGDHKFCCQDCRNGLTCDCGNWLDADEHERSNKNTTIQSLPY